MEGDQVGSYQRLEFLANSTLVGKLAGLLKRSERDAGNLNIGSGGRRQLEKTEEVFYLSSANNSARFCWHLLAISVACFSFSIP